MDSLRGRKVLIVEDEPLVAMVLSDMMQDLGVEVTRHAETFDEAREAAALNGFDAAIFDVNLHGQLSYPVAESLVLRGVPVVLVSGYARETAPPSLAKAPFLRKPYLSCEIAKALVRALGPPAD